MYFRNPEIIYFPRYVFFIGQKRYAVWLVRVSEFALKSKYLQRVKQSDLYRLRGQDCPRMYMKQSILSFIVIIIFIYILSRYFYPNHLACIACKDWLYIHSWIFIRFLEQSKGRVPQGIKPGTIQSHSVTTLLLAALHGLLQKHYTTSDCFEQWFASSQKEQTCSPWRNYLGGMPVSEGIHLGIQ